jgi:hypothetical protein
METLGYSAIASIKRTFLNGSSKESTVADESIKHVHTDAVTREEFEELKNEVHLIKGSIKRLLLDLREKLNDFESPLNDLRHIQEISDKGSGPVQKSAPVQIFMGTSPKHHIFKPPVVKRVRRKK